MQFTEYLHHHRFHRLLHLIGNLSILPISLHTLTRLRQREERNDRIRRLAEQIQGDLYMYGVSCMNDIVGIVSLMEF